MPFEFLVLRYFYYVFKPFVFTNGNQEGSQLVGSDNKSNYKEYVPYILSSIFKWNIHASVNFYVKSVTIRYLFLVVMHESYVMI